jgi:hypothetical protein
VSKKQSKEKPEGATKEPKSVQKMRAELLPYLSEPGIIGARAGDINVVLSEISKLSEAMQPRVKRARAALKGLRALNEKI